MAAKKMNITVFLTMLGFSFVPGLRCYMNRAEKVRMKIFQTDGFFSFTHMGGPQFVCDWHPKDGLELLLERLIERDYAPAIAYRRKRNLNLLLDSTE